MALNRYVEQNPYAPMKPVGAYDFVKPILPNIGRDKNGLVSELNKDNVMGIMNQQLATQEGQNMAKRMMEEAGLDFDSPDDVKKFLDQQYLLIQGKNPRQQNQGRSSSRGDSGNGSKGPTYEVTYSDSKEMMQDGNSNAIQLKDLPAVPIKLENGGLEVGTPIAIVKRKDGQLYLEYQADRDGEMGPYYVPYRMHRDAIETIYKRDIAEDLTKGTAKSEGSEKSKTSGKKQIKRSDIAAKAKAAGYSEAEYTKQLKKNNIEIID
jgi:NACalpha-BTF3-like transcription factor